MQVLCMRHGHADPANAVTSDAQRPLSERGCEQVRGVADALRAAGVKPTRIFASPLLRARQTAELVRKQLAVAAQVEPQPSLSYTSSAAGACAFIEGLSDGSVLAVGHMPTLPETIYLLSGRQLGGMTTAQVVCMEHGHCLWSLVPGDQAPRPL